MAKGTVKQNIVKSIVMMVFGACIVLGLFLMFTRGKSTNHTEDGELSKAQMIITDNLDKNYPPTPREVVDKYAQIMQVLYKEKISDDEQQQILLQLSKLMDNELLANQTDFYGSMSKEIASKKKEDYSIPTYIIQEASEISYTTVDGADVANVQCIFSLRHGTSSTPMKYLFVLRKDESGNWKILGWTNIGDDN